MPSPEFDFSDLDDLYREIIMDHYRRPRNAQELQSPTIKTHGLNPFCGDETSIQLVMNGEGRVEQVGVQGRGCSISQSSGSLMSDLLKEKTVEEIESLTELFRRMMQGGSLSEPERQRLGEAVVLEGVRRFPVRIKCALLAWMTLLEGLEGHRAKAGRRQGPPS
jgi:nitrogen fixation NifU-like protein